MNHQDENQKVKSKTDGLKAEKQSLNTYAKYTGVAFQMMAIIGLSAYIGYKTDEYYDHKTQWVTALACVLGVILSIYQTIRQLKP
ncbi:MAG: AtpZ/AtpI family protein [Daejeonella sp.]|uniref:AtpZ/AtpI family protein n=1 Tax=Daejeonella sp. TaxID=2805397 RepID=UPI002733486D|nr:AtpZ/AtpI family protein [Daejeonella sp.]MDP3469277.1 AtpZ/AtpI family protein [Daejeonella sp.]